MGRKNVIIGLINDVFCGWICMCSCFLLVFARPAEMRCFAGNSMWSGALDKFQTAVATGRSFVYFVCSTICWRLKD